MREYHLPDGTLVPAELQEKIANDVRYFDQAQTPEARSAVALRKISNEMMRLRQAIMGVGDDQTMSTRQAVAWEIIALGELGFSSEALRSTRHAKRLMVQYGLLDANGEPRL